MKNKIGYVVKRYPRFSETFIVNEILIHEQLGVPIEIFSLRPSVDTHFQDIISQVRAAVNYLPHGSVKSSDFWSACGGISRLGRRWDVLSEFVALPVLEVYQGIKLAEQVHAKGVSHLHAHFATSAATVARVAARLSDISYSVTMHAKDIYHDSVDPAELQAKIRDAKFVVTVSEFNRNHLASTFGHPEKIKVIYNGLDLQQFQYHRDQNKEPTLLAIGRLVPKKGFTDLVSACGLLRDAGVHFRCEIVGGGELEPELAQQVHALGLEAMVTLTGPLPQAVVRQKIAAAAMTVAPCVIAEDGNRDGLPTVITESLALGTPCISTEVTGIPEIIRHRDTGLIVSQHAPAELASAITQLLDDRKLREQLSVCGRQLVEQEFDSRTNVGRLANLLTHSAVPPTHVADFEPGPGNFEAPGHRHRRDQAQGVGQ